VGGGRGKLIGGLIVGGVVVAAGLFLLLRQPEREPATTREQPSGTRMNTESPASSPSVTAPSNIQDSIRQAEFAAREARIREMEDSISRAAQNAAAITSRADSIAMQRLKDSLQHVRDQLALAKENPPPAPSTPRVDTVYQARTEPASTPPKTDPAILARQRQADSSEVVAALQAFWEGLQSRDIPGMKSAYPDLPSKSEAMWQMFLDNARELDIVSNTKELNLADQVARATVAVKMNYRDARGSRAQDLVYDARLRKQNGRWVITSLEQNR
jgi:hypothetical protein